MPISGDMTLQELLDALIASEHGGVMLRWAALPSEDHLDEYVESTIEAGYECDGKCGSPTPEDCLRDTSVVCPSLFEAAQGEQESMDEGGFCPVFITVSVGSMAMMAKDVLGMAMDAMALTFGLDEKKMDQASLDEFIKARLGEGPIDMSQLMNELSDFLEGEAS